MGSPSVTLTALSKLACLTMGSLDRGTSPVPHRSARGFAGRRLYPLARGRSPRCRARASVDGRRNHTYFFIAQVSPFTGMGVPNRTRRCVAPQIPSAR